MDSVNRLNGSGNLNGKRSAKPKRKKERRRTAVGGGPADHPAEPVIAAAETAIKYLKDQLALVERYHSPVSEFYQARNEFHREYGTTITYYDDGSYDVVRNGGDV